MFLIDAIKLYIENKLKNCFILIRLFTGGESRAYSFVCFRVKFVSGIKIIIQKI